MATGSAEFMSYCQTLELERAKRLLGERNQLDASEAQQKLLQKMLLAALQESGRTYFNYDLWLETIAAVKDPTTPRTIQRTVQLLDSEVNLRQERLTSAGDLMGQPAPAWEIQSFPTLQRLELDQKKPERLPEEVRSLVSQPQAEAERALLANWLEWRATHRLRRAGFQVGPQLAPVLARLTPRGRNRMVKRLSGELSSGQRNEFEQANQAAMPAPKNSQAYRFAKPSRKLANYAVSFLLTLMGISGAFVTLFATQPATRDIASTGNQRINRNSRFNNPLPDQPVDPTIEAALIFSALAFDTKQKLGRLDQFKMWLSLPENQVDFLEEGLFPGPRSRERIKAHRESATIPKNRTPAELESVCGMCIDWLKTTRPIWEKELAGKPSFPTGPILKAFSELDTPTVLAWIRRDPEAEKLVDGLVFQDPIQRQRLAIYRAASKPPAPVDTPSRPQTWHEVLEKGDKRDPAIPTFKELALRRIPGTRSEPGDDFLEFLSQPDIAELLKPVKGQPIVLEVDQSISGLTPELREQLTKRWKEWKEQRENDIGNLPLKPRPNRPNLKKYP
ncbi:MAG: hypothetical protein ACKO0N_07335 [Planctomycetota bacterium]